MLQGHRWSGATLPCVVVCRGTLLAADSHGVHTLSHLTNFSCISRKIFANVTVAKQSRNGTRTSLESTLSRNLPANPGFFWLCQCGNMLVLCKLENLLAPQFTLLGDSTTEYLLLRIVMSTEWQARGKGQNTPCPVCSTQCAQNDVNFMVTKSCCGFGDPLISTEKDTELPQDRDTSLAEFLFP